MDCICMMAARYKLKETVSQKLRRLVQEKEEAERNHRPWLSGETAREELEEQLQSSWSQPRCRLFMYDFEENRRNNTEWKSKPFYQAPSPNGTARYKLQLGVYANGYGEVRGQNVSVFVYLLEGEDDDKLRWPVRVETTVLLLDQRKQPDHIKRTIVLEASRSSVAGIRGHGSESFGYLHPQPQQSVARSFEFGSPFNFATSPASSGASPFSGGSAFPSDEAACSVHTRSSTVKQKKRKGKRKILGEGSDLRFAWYSSGSTAEYVKDDTAQFEITTVNIRNI